jgi:nucleotide-binding universal stress UspA family protein
VEKENAMFKHILIPIDGSEFSDRAIDAGVRFAKSIGARVTGFIAEPDYSLPSYGEMINHRGESMDVYSTRSRAHAEGVLRRIEKRARDEGVDFDSSFVHSDDPVAAIVGAAEENECDLIVMASHGRRGLDKLIHGSATEGVMTHTQIPVLVLH